MGGVGLLFEIWIVDASIWQSARLAWTRVYWVLGGGVGCLFAHTSAVIVVGVCGSFVACHMCMCLRTCCVCACFCVCGVCDKL